MPPQWSKHNLLKSLLKEPLLHFVAMALVIFAVYGVFSRGGTLAPDRIIVTAPKIEQMAAIFAKTQHRPPTADELKALIDNYIKDEIYYREALILGLDKDDTVIRRRLRQKMEFLSDASIDALSPTDTDLDAYLKAHLADFEIEPMVAFQQVFLRPDRHGDKIDQDAASILEALRTSPETAPSSLGDPSLLPADLPLTRKMAVAQTFGPELGEALDQAIPGRWTGPVRSAFGLHLIRVSERKPGRMPALTEVRDAVAREWSNSKRKELEDRRLEEWLKRHPVTIESSAASGTAP
jgi:PPIC-type PPIASE domain